MIKDITFLFFIFISSFYLFNIIYGKDIKGVISLDRYTFDKIATFGRFDTLVKFDEEYPYGTQQDEYDKFVSIMNEQGQNQHDFLIANVIVEKKEDDANKKEDDDDEENNNDNKETKNENISIEKLNQVFIERFTINQKRLPAYLLFKKNSNQNKPIPYEGEVTSDGLTRFVKKELNLILLLEGCLEEWNMIATDFIGSNKEKQLEKMTYIEKEILTKYNRNDNENTNVSSVRVYFTIMKRITEHGNQYVEQEQKRIQNILDHGRIKEETKRQMKIKLNILASFIV